MISNMVYQATIRVLSERLKEARELREGAEKLAEQALALRPETQHDPGMRAVIDGIGHLRDQLRDLESKTTDQSAEITRRLGNNERSAARTQWVFFGLGVLVAVPVGLLGSYLAHILGW